jgi:hypothetical protein
MVAITKDTLFGVHSIVLLDRANGFLPFKDALFEVIGNIQINTSKEQKPLTGGSSSIPFEVEEGASSAEFSMTIRQCNSAIFEAIGGVVTRTSAASGGTISPLVNLSGGNLVAAATKIASVAIIPSTGEANLKTGRYIVRAMSATTVNIYGTTNQDFLRGTDVEFQDDELKLLASDITITTSGTTAVASLGIQLVGGSGTIALTTGTTAMFSVATPHKGIRDYSMNTIGSSSKYVGLVGYTQRKADGGIGEVFLPRVKLSGFPINLTEKEWPEFEVSGIITTDVNPYNTAEVGSHFIRNIIG